MDFQSGGLVEREMVTSAGGNTTLTVTSPQVQVFTGSGQTVTFPDATTMFIGQKFEVFNQGSTTLLVNTNGNANLAIIRPGTAILFRLETHSAAPGTWMQFITSVSLTAPHVFTSGAGSGTYVPSVSPSPAYVKVRMGGAGGGGSAQAYPINGNTGGTSNFGSIITCTGGTGGVNPATTGNGGIGGTSSISGTDVLPVTSVTGGSGQGANLQPNTGSNPDSGGMGETNPLAIAGASGPTTANGLNGANGGGGGGSSNTSSDTTGAGGGAGGYAEAILYGSAITSYAWTVGSGGTGAGYPSSNNAGGNGGDGFLIIEEHFQ
jgi:hypothetical protein